MSQYGTSEDYCFGYDAGADETAEIYADLVKTARNLLKRWPTGKNLTVQIQALDRAVKELPKTGRRYLDSTAYPETDEGEAD